MRTPWPGFLSIVLLLWPLQAYAANFTFSYSKATQCDDFQVSWTGGTAPFQLTIVPSFGTPRTTKIPDGSFSNSRGSFTTTMNMPKGQQIVVVMSDATGFGSGGVTPVITVGPTVSKTACDTSDPGVDFTYEANSALAQCRTYTFSLYKDAVQPIQITGIVPGGSTFILNPPRGPLSFDWVADIAANTELVFFMTDANNRQGGSTQFASVLLSDDKTCLDKNSPASVAHPPSMTATSKAAAGTKSSTHTQTSTSSATSSPDTDDPSKSSPAGTLAAAIVGTLVALVVLGSLIWFYLRRRNGGGFLGRKFQKQEVDLMKGDPGLPPHQSLSPYPLYPTDNFGDGATPHSSVNLLHRTPSADAASTLNFARPPQTATTAQFPPGTRPDSIHDTSLYGNGSGYGGASQYGTAAAAAYGGVRPEGSVASWDQSVTSSAAQRKAAQAGVSTYQTPARFILHTDIEDDLPPPPVDEVIELPPQYSERRAPPPGAGASGAGQEDHHPPASPSGLPYR
ncbi:hypothetical protein K466DRAFT_593619 [Polyporus arcularius HHB13444]|uniref:Uncharacterized protein n=1 Tax=Polyporus arcularius HHB13444 TaxID=1314778 RepID=A0A5C3PX83_9APHY|nr:hypothetical protein K466DRAFT_593619 [Polyporus arcularius HHB13444]